MGVTNVKELEAQLSEDLLKGIDGKLEALRPKMAKIEEQLAPLRAEENVLLEMRSRVSGAGRRPARRQGTRTPQGTRQNEFVKIVQDSPGITVSDIAKKMGVEPTYLYRVRTNAIQAGLVRKEGSKVFPATPVAA